MSSKKSHKEEQRKVPHNVTEKTLGECAMTHLDQLEFAHFNLIGEEREKRIKMLIESFFKIKNSVWAGKNFTIAGPVVKDNDDEEKRELFVVDGTIVYVEGDRMWGLCEKDYLGKTTGKNLKSLGKFILMD